MKAKDVEIYWQQQRLERIRTLRALASEIQSAVGVLEASEVPFMENWRERDLLDAAYEAFGVEGLWDQAREYGALAEGDE